MRSGVKLLELNDLVVLIDEFGNKHLLKITKETKKIRGVGYLNLSQLIGKKFGEKVEIGNRSFILLTPSIIDILEGIKRKPQIIIPKDSAQIAMYCDVHSGCKIIEGGVGSGALTIALANLVRPNGKIISYEKRKDFADFARKNIVLAGFKDYSEIKIKDITKGIDEKGVDAIILDIPNPWEVVEHAFESLKVCGHFASFIPTINQLEKVVNALKEYDFIEIRSFETLQREIVVSISGTRPSYDMLGHTGYITFARKSGRKGKCKSLCFLYKKKTKA